MVKKVALCLGSNKGEKGKNIRKAVRLLERKLETKTEKSPVYEADPYYKNEDKKDKYYNCCLKFEKDISVHEVFEIASETENEMGRERDYPNAPRIIDIDIIFCDNEIIADNELAVPHTGMQDRRFVLEPLSKIMGEFTHPAIGMTVNDLLYECDDKTRLKEIKDFWKG